MIKAEKKLKEDHDVAANIRNEFFKLEAENNKLKNENSKLQDDVMKLRAKLRDFGCEL